MNNHVDQKGKLSEKYSSTKHSRTDSMGPKLASNKNIPIVANIDDPEVNFLAELIYEQM